MAIFWIIWWPGSWKTRVINQLAKEGYNTKKEAATAIQEEYKVDMDTAEWNLFMDQNIIPYKVNQFKEAASEELSSKMNSVFIDSSIYSTKVYMDKYWTKYEPDMFTKLAEKYMYDYVFSFEHVWEMEDNWSRKNDTLEDALLLEVAKKKVHEDLWYTVINVPLFYEKKENITEEEKGKLIDEAVWKRIKLMLTVLEKTVGEFIQEKHNHIVRKVTQYEDRKKEIFWKKYPNGKQYERVTSKVIEEIKNDVKSSQVEIELLEIFEDSKLLVDTVRNSETSKLLVLDYQLKSPAFLKEDYISTFRMVHKAARLVWRINKIKLPDVPDSAIEIDDEKYLKAQQQLNHAIDTETPTTFK